MLYTVVPLHPPPLPTTSCTSRLVRKTTTHHQHQPTTIKSIRSCLVRLTTVRARYIQCTARTVQYRDEWHTAPVPSWTGPGPSPPSSHQGRLPKILPRSPCPPRAPIDARLDPGSHQDYYEYVAESMIKSHLCRIDCRVRSFRPPGPRRLLPPLTRYIQYIITCCLLPASDVQSVSNPLSPTFWRCIHFTTTTTTTSSPPPPSLPSLLSIHSPIPISHPPPITASYDRGIFCLGFSSRAIPRGCGGTATVRILKSPPSAPPPPHWIPALVVRRHVRCYEVGPKPKVRQT